MLQHGNSFFWLHFISHKFLFKELVLLLKISSLLFKFFFLLLDQLLNFLFIFFLFLEILLLKLFLFKFIVIFQLHDCLLRSVVSFDLIIFSLLLVVLELHFEFLNAILKLWCFLLIFSWDLLLLRSF